MYTTYSLSANELDSKFIKSIKTQYKDKRIEITISETDETEYLLKSKKNKEFLLTAVKDIEENKNLVTPDQNQFK
jgi:hypothetical protein